MAYAEIVRQCYQGLQFEHERVLRAVLGMYIGQCYGDDHADDNDDGTEGKSQRGQGEVRVNRSSIERNAAEDDLEENISRHKTGC